MRMNFASERNATVLRSAGVRRFLQHNRLRQAARLGDLSTALPVCAMRAGNHPRVRVGRGERVAAAG